MDSLTVASSPSVSVCSIRARPEERLLMVARNPISRSSSPRKTLRLSAISTSPGPSPRSRSIRYAAVDPAARLSMPTYATRWLSGMSVTRVTTGIPDLSSLAMASVISGTSGALSTTPMEPRCRMSSRTFTTSAGRPFSRKSNRDRTTAGASDGSSASSADLTAEENRSGACITTSTRKVRPVSRSWLRCRSRSVMACCTLLAVLARTPGRLLRTRSTVASLRPGLTGDLADRIGMSHAGILMG